MNAKSILTNFSLSISIFIYSELLLSEFYHQAIGRDRSENVLAYETNVYRNFVTETVVNLALWSWRLFHIISNSMTKNYYVQVLCYQVYLLQIPKFSFFFLSKSKFQFGKFFGSIPSYSTQLYMHVYLTVSLTENRTSV